MPNANPNGSGYVNFDLYKNLNKFASQQGAQRVSSGADSMGQQAQDAQGKANDNFNQAVSQGTVTFNPDAANQRQAGSYNPMKRQALPGPMTYGAAPQPKVIDTGMDYAKKVAGSQYSGPQDLQSYAPDQYDQLSQQAQAVQDATSGLNTESGLAAYLQKYGGGAGYNPAMSSFDSALYQQADPGSFMALSQRYRNLLKGLQDSEDASKKTSAAAKDASDKAVQQANGFIGGRKALQEKADMAPTKGEKQPTAGSVKTDKLGTRGQTRRTLNG